MGKGFVLLFVLFFLISSCLTLTFPAKADPRTLVVPDNYQTISSAIGNAADGDTILVRKGTYKEETLEINKTLLLVGEDAINTIINLHPPYNETWVLTKPFFSYSNAITIKANDVRLLNLTMLIAAPGGYISATGDRIQITGSNITTGPTTGLSIGGSYCNITENTSGGIISLSGSSNIIARNSFSKIYISGNSNAINNNTCWNLRLSNANQNVVSGNKVGTTTQHSNGVYVIGDSSHNIFCANYIAGYSYDVEINSASAENNSFYHNNFINNYNNHVYINTGNLTGVINFWDYRGEGNYWEDYKGTDSNRDGIGDTPYVIDGTNIDNYPLMFPFDIENEEILLPPSNPFSAILVTVLVVAAVVSVGIIVYFKKRKQ
jgi:nitrous oxidase accessory protein